jgi:hypothetical protein
MWSLIPLIIQGGLFGYVAGQTFEDPVAFFSACLANSILVVAYGAFRSDEP